MKRNICIFFFIFPFYNSTFAQHVKLISSGINANLNDAAIIDGTAFFSANDGINGWELWQSDGTQEKTKLVKDIFTGTRFDNSRPQKFTNINLQKFVFIAKTKEANANQLLISDGTNAGTQIIPGVVDPSNLYKINEKIYFIGKKTSTNIRSLFVLTTNSITPIVLLDNVTNSTIFKTGDLYYLMQTESLYQINESLNTVKKILTYSVYRNDKKPSKIVTAKSLIYLFYKNSSTSYDMVRYNIANNTFVKIKNFYFLDDVKEPAQFNGEDNIYFTADDGNYGKELWKSNGTSEGTKMISDINRGGTGSSPSNMFITPNFLIFQAFERDVSSFDRKSYVYKFDIKKNTLNKLKNEKNEPGSQIYLSEKISDNKTYFFANFYTNDPDSSSNLYYNSFYLKTASYNLIFSDTENKVSNSSYLYSTDKEFNGKYYWSGMESKFGSAAYCRGTAIYEYDPIAQNTKITNHFPDSNYEDNNPISDSRDIYTFQIVKHGIIGAKRVSDIESDYPPRIFGIYNVSDCGGTVEIVSSNGRFANCVNSNAEFSYSLKPNIEIKKNEWILDPPGSFCGSLGNNKTLKFDKNKVGILFISITDKNGCMLLSDTYISSIEGGIQAQINTSFESICKNETKVINTKILSGVEPFSFSWYKDDIKLIGKISDSLQINESGNYKINITDGSGCETSLSKEIKSSNFTVSITGNNSICANENTNLNANIIGGIAPFIYQWKSGNSIVGSNSNILNTSSAAQYNVSVTDSKGCTGISSNFTITAKPTPNVTVSKNGETNILTGNSVILSVPIASGQTYQWLNDGKVISGATSNSYKAENEGDYSVIVTKSGCSATSENIQVSLILANELEIISKDLKAYPNPFGNSINVNIINSEIKEAKLFLINSAGSTVKEWYLTKQENVLELIDLPSGIYLLQTDLDKRNSSIKLIKNN
ncbi:T9SS C-terminal target domain-containing protein [Lacihabitans sp. LS3-19]|uniref:ELWxxDGT repeat protein n=1 Tax=Lacihabitans sp. LS3-19 TaxID=2487335 RepID=UPI0020CF0F4C|nr:ELWxxDGT repeat protein [Lacihabitans sp. LS3-19]MCP9767080.1 T9SS C-terminal target domain-containing protein [Lacihabitans sp. LS3-19]